MSTDEEINSPQNKGKSGFQATARNKPDRSKSSNKVTESNVIARFAACGRCSFFMSDYRLSQKPDWLPNALLDARKGWLTMEWDTPLRNLVFGAYGTRTDIESIYLEGSCPECRRVFIYQAETEEAPASFRIQL